MRTTFNKKEMEAIKTMAKQMDVPEAKVPVMALRFYQVHMAMVSRGAVHVKWFDRKNKQVQFDTLRKKRS